VALLFNQKNIKIMLFQSPMEQFSILPSILLSFGNLVFVFPTTFFYLCLPVLFLVFLIFTLYFESGSLKGFNLSKGIGLINLGALYFKLIRMLCVDILGRERGLRVYPLFGSLFYFIFSLNLIGLLPYSLSLTSHLSGVFSLSFIFSLATIIQMFATHGRRAFALFRPNGLRLFFMPFVIIIEIVSHFSRFLTIPGRLSANVMAGHILLKVILGLVGSLLAIKSLAAVFVSFFLFLALFFLFVLEVVIAFVQAYLFCLITLLFLNESYTLN
jgi:ATP synthase subunit 6